MAFIPNFSAFRSRAPLLQVPAWKFLIWIGGHLVRSGHLSVWVTSFIFSAIHFQFYGFLPRFILGLIFGYLFLWTRKLWLSVTAHFINNALPTVWSYTRGWETINEKHQPVLQDRLRCLYFPCLQVQ